MDPLDAYRKQFSSLHVDTSRSRWTKETRYRAPHKPLLLMAVMDLIAQGTITSNLIELTADLGEIFTIYWSKVMPPSHRGNLALPFFHLKNDGFWHLLPRPGKESFLTASRQIRSLNQLRDTVLGATLDPELYALLCTVRTRDLLRATLLERYFSDEIHEPIIQQSTINLEAFQYSQTLLGEMANTTLREKPAERWTPIARDQGFRRAIITAYNHRCALCGIRMLTPDGHTVLEAAHIVPWSLSHNDSPNNGLGLCRLCHWAFDEGLMAISGTYDVMISPQLNAEDNIPGQLGILAKRPIIGPTDRRYWPDAEAVSWHRKNVFRKRY